MTRIKLYDRFSFVTEAFRLVERFPDREWETLRSNAIQYLQAGQYSLDAQETLINGGFELWKANNKSNKTGDFEVLFRTAKIPDFVTFEKQRGNVRFGWVSTALGLLGHSIWYIAVDLNASKEIQAVRVPALRITSESVDTALVDAETLIRANGAPSGLDRVHTAFHAYLRSVCDEANLQYAPDSGITFLFQRIRKDHPRLKFTDFEEAERIEPIHRGVSKIVDALDGLRDKSSMAHPNVLLGEPEAMLTINCVRTLLHYLNDKLR